MVGGNQGRFGSSGGGNKGSGSIRGVKTGEGSDQKEQRNRGRVWVQREGENEGGFGSTRDWFLQQDGRADER